MITLTDDEQATALRAARYSHAGLKKLIEAATTPSIVEAMSGNLANLERVIKVLERKNDNGMWRCLCAGNPWRHPTCSVCPTCGMAVPT